MTNALGSYYDFRVLNSFLGITNYIPFPDTIYGALWIVTPDRDGTGGTEVANAGSYARVPIDASSNTLWAPTAVGDNLKFNGEIIAFPRATANWGTITAVTFMSSGTYGAGDLYMVAELFAARTVNSGTMPYFVVGGIEWEVPAA